MMRNVSQWREFWEASSLSLPGAREFGERVRSFQPLVPEPEPFVQSGPDRPLPKVRDGLQRLLKNRRSTREFSRSAIGERDISKLFSSFAASGGRRTYPSAGGLYPVHVFGLMLRASEPWSQKAVRYEPSLHALGVMRDALSVENAERACSLDEGIHPQIIVVFVVYPDELERKYGERSARFALIEVGHAAQNLSLRIAKSGLRGYELGGLQDKSVKRLLGLGETDSLIAHGYACGL